MEYEVDKIVKRRKNHMKIEYLVSWKGYDDLTWLPVASLGRLC